MGRPRLDESRREEILAAFERCVVRDGFASTTLQNVATEAGLPRPLIRHFVGNREDMVNELIERVTHRASEALLTFTSSGQEPCLGELLDFLFGGMFLSDASNSVADQLWDLAASDEQVRKKLKEMYQTFRSTLVRKMKQEGLGESTGQRTAFAQMLLSLAYGEACFDWLGMKTGRRNTTRVLAENMVRQLL